MNLESLLLEILSVTLFSSFGGFTVYLIREKANSWMIAMAVISTIATGSAFLNNTVGVPLKKILEHVEHIEQNQRKMSPYSK